MEAYEKELTEKLSEYREKTFKEIDQIAHSKSAHKNESFSKKLENLSEELLGMLNLLINLKKDFDQNNQFLNKKLHYLEKCVSNNKCNLANPWSQQKYQNQSIRRNRIVIFGIPKRMSKDNFIPNLYAKLKIDDESIYKIMNNKLIKKTFWINTKNTPTHKSKPLNVEFQNFDEKLNLLKQIKKKVYSLPNDHELKNIQIFPDRTFKQREQFKLLKNEMATKNQNLKNENISNKKFIIKNMELVEINIATNKENR